MSKALKDTLPRTRKAWLAKQKAIENIYNSWERSFHDLLRFLQAMQQPVLGMVVEKETLPMPPQGGQTVEGFVKFHCRFWSFILCIDRFQYCKPIVQVNET